MKILGQVFLILLICSSCSSRQNEKSPEDRRADIFYAQGTRNLVDKEYTKALKHLLEANSIRNNDTKIHTNLGMAYYFKKNSDLAKKHLLKALEIDPKNSDARLNIATIYMEENNFNDAEMQYKAVLNDLVYEKQFRTYYNLGLLEAKRNNMTMAIKYLKQSIEIDENYCPSFFQLGQIYYRQKEFKNALKMFRESSMGTCFENPEPHYMQALTLIKMKKYSEATGKLEEMTEKFALTKYEALARKAIIEVNHLKNQSYSEQMKAENNQGNILTPDF